MSSSGLSRRHLTAEGGVCTQPVNVGSRPEKWPFHKVKVGRLGPYTNLNSKHFLR